MNTRQLRKLAQMRAVVGYLGEREQSAWWQSSFFAPGSRAFLTPMFSRTYVLAQCGGVTKAAAAIHDERIGVGNVYHLFRLPADLEQSLHQAMQESKVCQDIQDILSTQETALAFLQEQADEPITAGVGPVLVGSVHDLRDLSRWRTVAAHYVEAFRQSWEIYPYFADRE